MEGSRGRRRGDFDSLMPEGARMEKELQTASTSSVPAIVAAAGEHAVEEYRAFFAAYAHPPTRRAYQSYAERFLRWAEDRGLALTEIQFFDTVFYANDLAQSLAPT